MFKNTSRSEILTVSSLFIVFAVILSVSNWIRWQFGAADNAFLVQLANNIAERGLPYSQISNAVKYLFSEILGKSASVVCNLDLHFPEVKEFNYFKWHTYAFLYLLAPLHWFFSARDTIPVLIAFAFVSLLFTSYFYLRSKNISKLLSFLFVILIYIHPAWNQSITGQIYNDRLYLYFGLPFLILLFERPDKLKTIFILGIVIASLSDRFGAIIGIQTLFFALLPVLEKKKPHFKLLFVGMLFILITSLILNFVSDYEANKSFSQSLHPSSFLENFKVDTFRENFFVFLLLTFVGLGTFCFFKPTLLPLLLVNIYPNAIGNLGGAEKTGFLTHYHTTYFPVLVFVGLLGFVQFANSFRRLGKYGIATVLGVLTVLNIYIVTTMVPGIKNLDRPLTSYLSVLGGIGKLYDGQYEYYQSLMKVRDHIPVNSKVVTTEHALPIIGLQSEVSLVPLGLADADYAFLPVIREPHQGIGMRIGGSSSYLGEKDTMSQDDCISQHLETYGYDMGNIKRFGSWALLKRNK